MNVELSKQNIFIVDDSPLNIRVLSAGLSDSYKLKVATSGEKALEILASEYNPDLIILDIEMPKMDGYEVCRRLKEDERTKNIPVVFVTAKGEMEDEAKGRELGAIDYFVKPFIMPIVKERLKMHLSRKE